MIEVAVQSNQKILSSLGYKNLTSDIAELSPILILRVHMNSPKWRPIAEYSFYALIFVAFFSF